MNSWTSGTDFSFFDACVDGVQQVGSVLVALGEFGQFLPDQLPLMVAHHPLKCGVHILGRGQKKILSKKKKQERIRNQPPTRIVFMRTVLSAAAAYRSLRRWVKCGDSFCILSDCDFQ